MPGTAAPSVHYRIARPNELAPFQLLLRVAAFLVLGVLGVSFGTVLAAAYLALPVLAAVRIGTIGANAYLAEDGPRITTGLRWLAAVSAWAGLVSDHFPARSPDETVELQIESAPPPPTAPQALWRIITGLPSAFVLMLLGAIGTLVWLWAALTILVSRKIGAGAFAYLVGLQRWSIHLLAYQACLVDDYPPFALGEPEPPVAHSLLQHQS